MYLYRTHPSKEVTTIYCQRGCSLIAYIAGSGMDAVFRCGSRRTKPINLCGQHSRPRDNTSLSRVYEPLFSIALSSNFGTAPYRTLPSEGKQDKIKPSQTTYLGGSPGASQASRQKHALPEGGNSNPYARFGWCWCFRHLRISLCLFLLFVIFLDVRDHERTSEFPRALVHNVQGCVIPFGQGRRTRRLLFRNISRGS